MATTMQESGWVAVRKGRTRPVRVADALADAGSYLLLTVMVIQTVFPLLWLFLSSLKPRVEQFYVPPAILFRPSLSNYVQVFTRLPFHRFYLNSLVVAVSTTLLALLIAVPAAYGFSRFRFRRQNDLLFWVLSTRMAPPVGVIIPFALLAKWLGLYDRLGTLVVLYLVLNVGIAVYLAKRFFDQVPADIDQAALLDGYTWFGAFRRFIFPLCAPGILAIGVLCFINAWNEFMFALILTGENSKTLPIAVSSFITVQGVDWGPMAAAGMLMMLPVIVFAFLIQKYFIRGFRLGV